MGVDKGRFTYHVDNDSGDVSQFHGWTKMLCSNNTDIAITAPATTVVVLGGVITYGSTAISIAGSITVSGDWINNSSNDCFGISQGIVALNGANQVKRFSII